MSKVKVLPVDVYRSARRGGYDCTNGGVSSRFDSLYLICDKGWLEVDDTDERLVKIETMRFGGNTYQHVVPVNDRHKRAVSYMMGGNYISTSDSRFPSDYPIPVHDRTETQEGYDVLTQEEFDILYD